MKAACALDPFCLNSFLTFRYVVSETAEWVPGVCPKWPRIDPSERFKVEDAGQLLEALRYLIGQALNQGHVGLLLGGGIDSAILAALLPRGTPVYTVRFEADELVDESQAASMYARQCGLRHRVVTVTWDDCAERVDWLMQHKQSPLHPVEVALALASCVASADGVQTLLVGNGADSTFGGLDRLLSRDWTLEEFIKRYTFLDPAAVLREPVSTRFVFEEYGKQKIFDVVGFLKEVHGRGIIQAFDNAIAAGGCASVSPYESLVLAGPLDLARIRHGEPKYLLREIFSQFYPNLPLSKKISFARPMDCWMKPWTGPQRAEFKPGLDVHYLSGEQKWLLYSLERFLNCIEND